MKIYTIQCHLQPCSQVLHSKCLEIFSERSNLPIHRYTWLALLGAFLSFATFFCTSLGTCGSIPGDLGISLQECPHMAHGGALDGWQIIASFQHGHVPHRLVWLSSSLTISLTVRFTISVAVTIAVTISAGAGVAGRGDACA